MQIKNKTFYFLIILLSCIIMLSSCKRSTEPLFNTSNLQLQVLDVSCTEAWLSLKAKNAYLNKTLKLYQDDSLKLEKILTTEDSILYIDSLWPNTSYQFRVTVYNGNKLIGKSSTVTATTMDTTSHDFTWQTFEFGGQGGSSSFYDVAIVDENDPSGGASRTGIWAVGEIYTADDKYNAAHWDGKRWELIKVPYVDDKGYVWITPIYSIFAFSSNDIWFEGGVHWNGSNFNSRKMNIDFPSHVNKMWGTSSTDLYVVGNNGMIAHYNGQQWQRIESGTALNLLDIFGVLGKILVTGSNLFHGPEKIVLFIKNNKAISIEDSLFTNNLTSVWSQNGLKWYFTGYETFVSSQFFNGKFTKLTTLPEVLKYRIRGSSLNNIFIVGQRGFIWHYNGIRWRDLSDNIGIYYSVAVKKDIIVTVGNRPSGFIIGPARIRIGIRN